MLIIRLQCKRCLQDYELLPGRPLSDFCETCHRKLGRLTSEAEAYGTKEREEFARLAQNRAGRNPLRTFVFPKPKP